MITAVTAPKFGRNVNFALTNSEQKVQRNSELVQSNNVLMCAAVSKANFMPLSKRLSFTGIYDEFPSIKCTTEENPVVKMDKILPYHYYKGGFYKKMANDIATALGPDKNIILSQKETTVPEMLVQDFTRAVLAGNYSNLGIKSNSNIKVIDYKKLRQQPEGFVQVVNSLFSDNTDKKTILFIKGYEDLIIDGKREIPFSQKIIDKNGKEITKKNFITITDSFLTNRDFLKADNLQIVGIIPEKIMQVFASKEQLSENLYTVKNTIKDDMVLPLNGISTKQTKELLKKDKRFLNSVFLKYSETEPIRISDKAIDKLVDRAAVSINGTFPAKALQLIDLMAADKVIRKQHLIKEEDVDNFFGKKDLLLSSIKDTSNYHAVENVKTKLSDVGGLHKAKEEIEDIVNFLKNPETYLATGKDAPKGALFAGGPGTGKTYFASAVAGSCDIPFIAVSASSFPAKYVGEGAANVRKAFAKARALAADSGKNSAVLFIDEIDAVGKKRGHGNDGGEGDATLNALLTEMDGLETKGSNIKIVVLAATNRADMLDDALKRPGRFDSLVHFDPPSTKKETREIIDVHAKKLKFANDVSKNQILDDLAERLTDHSGAEIEKTIREAQKLVGERVYKTFKGSTPPKDAFFVTANDITEAFLRARAGRVNLDNEANKMTKERTVIHEAGHATIKNFFKPEDLDFISNQSRGDYLGVTFMKGDKENPKFKEVIKDIACDFAGNGAEKELINDSDAGWSGDLQHVASRIKYSIERWGLGIHSPKMNLEDSETKMMYKDEIKKDVKVFEKTAKYVSDKILDFHKDFLTKTYMEKYRAESESGMGGNVLSGTEFNSMVKTWVKENGKEKELAKLHNHIDKVINMASHGDLSFLPTKNIFKKIIKLFKV